MQVILTRKSLPLVGNGPGAVHIDNPDADLSAQDRLHAQHFPMSRPTALRPVCLSAGGVNTTQTRSCLGRVFCFEHSVARARLNRWPHHQLYLAMHRFQWILYGIISKYRH